MAIDKLTTASLLDNSVTSPKLAPGAVTSDDIGDSSLPLSKISQINLNIAPEVLEIQVSAPQAGQDTAWLWTWLTSSLPYARVDITNSPELQVPLYKQGTYTVNNFAAYDLFGDMTQTHSLYLKWIDGAGTDNLVDWAVSSGPVSDSHPDINSGNATDVQRINISVPSTITLPTLTAPSVAYTVTNNGSGAYTFSGSASGDNPNLGPFYRGGTYTINITATGHPFYFTTDNGTNFSSGTYFGEYTDGVTGSRTDSGTITFTVPSDAPDTLYYQCGNHSAMRGAITVKDLAVETNINGNYVVYFQHTQEGHKTPVELRPIPSLVNQMCLVYDATTDTFVPQDLATYVENTPSFENKIREVAGTAELVVEDGSAVVAKVNVYADSTYLPLVGNNAGDQAFATDNNKLYIWDGSAWQVAGAASTSELSEGTNLYYTDARVASYLSNNDFDTATNIVASITDSAPTTLDTLNELAAALGDDPNFATTVTNSIATKAPLADPVFTGQLTASGPLDANLVTQSTDATTGVKFIDPDGTGHLHYVGASDHFYTTSRLSVGTAANNTSLDVYHAVNNTVAWLESGDAGVNITFKDSNTTNRPYIGATGDNIVLGHVSGGDKVTILPSGNVGIGTDNPEGKLTNYTSTTRFQSLQGINADLEIVSDNNTNAVALIKGTGLGDLLNVFDDSTEVFTILDGGRVGIGTNAPVNRLHVHNPAKTTPASATIGGSGIVSSGADGVLELLSEDDDSTWGHALTFKRYRQDTGALIKGYGFSTFTATGNQNANEFVRMGLHYGADVFPQNNTEIMTWEPNGNVGINISDPAVKLHAKNASGSVAFFDTDSNPYVFIRNSTSAVGEKATLGFAPANNISGVEIQAVAEENFSTTADRSAGLSLRTRSNGIWGDRLYIKSNGNIGIGDITDPLYRMVISQEDNVGPSIELRQASNKRVWINNAGSTGHGAGRDSRFEINGTEVGHIWLGAGTVTLSNSVGDGSEVLMVNDGKVTIGDDITNTGAILNVKHYGQDTVSGEGHVSYKLDNNSNYSIHRLDTSGHFNIDQYGTIGWRHAQRRWSNQAVTSFYDQINATNSISHWTDSGTKFYTHLCTLSTYQAAGAIIINTNIPGHDQSGNANMFSFRVTGFWYDSTSGGAIDMVVGCYAGENNYYNTTLTGTYPNAWKGKTWFATNSNGKVCLILGDTTTNQQCEIAVTDFVQGFINANTSYATGWSAELVTSYSVTQQSTIYPRNPGGMQIIDGTSRNSIYSTSGVFTVSSTGVFTVIGTLSHFKIDIHVNVNVSDDEGGGNINPYANGVIERSINGGAWTVADGTGISDQGGVSCHVEMSPPRVGTASNGDTYMWHQDRYRTKNHSSTFIDQPGLNMGDTLQYRLRCNKTNGNHIKIGEPLGHGSDDNYMAQPYGFIVQEFTPWS